MPVNSDKQLDWSLFIFGNSIDRLSCGIVPDSVCHIQPKYVARVHENVNVGFDWARFWETVFSCVSKISQYIFCTCYAVYRCRTTDDFGFPVANFKYQGTNLG